MAADAPRSAEMVAERIPANRAWAPHETRIYALQVAVEFINGDKTKASYSAADVIRTAKKFEAYLTSAPIDGFDPGAVDVEADGDGLGSRC